MQPLNLGITFLNDTNRYGVVIWHNINPYLRKLQNFAFMQAADRAGQS
jgi:hypothetical protein